MTGLPSTVVCTACGPVMMRSGRYRFLLAQVVDLCLQVGERIDARASSNLLLLLGQKHDLARVAGRDKVERLGVVGERQAVGDDRRQVEAFLEQRRGAVPRVEQAPAGDAVDAEPLKMTSCDRSSVAGTACVPRSETRPPLVTAARPWWSAADEPDISSTMSTPLPSVSARSRATTSSACVEDQVGAHALGHRAPLGIEVRREDGARAGLLEHADAHQADRSAAGDDRRLAGDVLDEGRKDGVAERLLEGGDLNDMPSETHALTSGMTTYWANEPGRWTPRMRMFWHT